MTLDIENIDHIDWSTYETFDQWSELLKALLVLGRGVSNLNATQKKSLADAFEGFGDHSDVPGEFDRVIQLDNIAYGCATALSKQLISENIQGLKLASAEYERVIGAIDQAAQSAARDARKIRFEKLIDVTTALTNVVGSIRALDTALDQKSDKAIVDAVKAATPSINKLRQVLTANH